MRFGLALCSLTCSATLALGQNGTTYHTVTAITTQSVNTGLGTTRTGVVDGTGTTSVVYDGNELRLNTLTANGVTYQSLTSGQVFVQRNTGASTFPNTNANQTVAWNALVSTGTNTRTVSGVYSNTTAGILARNNLRAGAENTFLNSENSGASNNIERIDYVFGSGFASATTRGFAVFERGQNTSGTSGTFKVAAITGWNGTSITGIGSTVVTVSANDYGNGTLNGNLNYDVYRFNTAAGPQLDNLSSANLGPQGLSGAYIPTTALAPAGTTIFGYVVFSADVTATGNSLIDVTNSSVYSSSSTVSDVDFAATGASLYTPVPEPTTCGLAIIGGVWAIGRWRKRKA